MQPEAAETDSTDEYEGWDPLDSESDLDPDLMSGWLGLNSSVSSFIRKVTETNARTDKQSACINCCDIEKPNAVGVPSDLSNSNGSTGSCHLEILAKSTCSGHLPDFSPRKLSLLHGAPSAPAANDQAPLDADVSLAVVVRHLLFPANPWRSIVGVVCILSIAIIGISYYICIYQSGRAPSAECPLVHNCFHCPGSAKTDFCQSINTSVYDLPISKNQYYKNVLPTVKEETFPISKYLFPHHFNLVAVHASTRRQNVHLRHLLREIRLEMARMRRRAYRIRLAHVELMRPLNSPVKRSEEQQIAKGTIPLLVEFPSQQMATYQPFAQERQINSLNTLDASVSKLNDLVQKMHLLRTSSTAEKISSWLVPKHGEQVTAKRIHKRMRKWAFSLSQAVTSFVGTIEKTLRKMDEFVSLACPKSSVLNHVKSRARAWSSGPPSWISRLFAVTGNTGNHEQCTRQKCSSSRKSKAEEQKVTSQEVRNIPSEDAMFSQVSKDKSGSSLHAENDMHVGWQFQASDQRKALRDREGYQSFSPSWIFRRSNKRGSLRHHNV
ncbi:hypothetical protein TTRE_0000242501 [Trichuris trichiura]|uniref:Uncharacterized protein n=1 Tax=Trichuris trichiura TaxID=36087 RepID=A0A077Z668_TRITR|nr:hypothetical protein TTRE_0000242501 [Trichuris trichiura]